MSLFDTMGMIGNYDDRKVAMAEMGNGLIVSTAWTTDEGYETAIILTDGEVCPVARYATKELATSGHPVWVEFATDGIGKIVIVLGSYENDWAEQTRVLS